MPGGQGRNRFDLLGSARGAIYFAETEEHAVAEMIQAYRNLPTPLTNDDLTAWGHRLALASVTFAPEIWAGIADLCVPATLDQLGITADIPAHRDRKRTQQIASILYDRQHTGLRWWSAFRGEWHSVVLFHDRLPPGAISYGTPIPLDITSPAVLAAARLLDIG